MEVCKSRELYENPLHPYARALFSAAPIADPFVEKTRQRIIVKDEMPTPLNPPVGCSFHPVASWPFLMCPGRSALERGPSEPPGSLF